MLFRYYNLSSFAILTFNLVSFLIKIFIKSLMYGKFKYVVFAIPNYFIEKQLK